MTWRHEPVPLPRGVCSVCEADVALRRGGEVREHRAWPADVPGEPKQRRRLSDAPVCPGAGRPALEVSP